MGPSPTLALASFGLDAGLQSVFGNPLVLGGAGLLVLVGIGYAGSRVLSRVRGGGRTDATPADEDDDETEFSVSYTPIESTSDDSWTPDSGGVSSGSSATNGGTSRSSSSSAGRSAAASSSAGGGSDDGTLDLGDVDDEEDSGTDTRIFTGARNAGAQRCPDCSKELPPNGEFEFCPFCGIEL